MAVKTPSGRYIEDDICAIRFMVGGVMAGDAKPKIVAAIPAYNEAKYIGSVVLKARQYADEVIVVDDGSRDATAEIATLAGATVVRHPGNQGKGVAVQSLLAEARKRSPDVLVILDADYQHRTEEIPRLAQGVADGADLVIGSRRVQRASIPPYRRAGQRVIAYFSHVLSRKKVWDTESGFRALSRRAIAEIDLKERGFAVESEMILAAVSRGLKIIEVPISVIYTEDGSTLNPVRHGLGILTRMVAMISERRPLFFFGMGGVVLVMLGIIEGIITLNVFTATSVAPAGTAVLSALLLMVGMFSIFTGLILNVIANVISKWRS